MLFVHIKIGSCVHTPPQKALALPTTALVGQ